jgi:hypothetical protein
MVITKEARGKKQTNIVAVDKQIFNYEENGIWPVNMSL